jgi:predicted nucleic acid-binding protein
MTTGLKTHFRAGAASARCVLDSGGLSALCGRSTHARAWLQELLARDGAIVVPTPVLVEATTGESGRDAEVNRVLQVLQRATGVLSAPDEATARRAGRLRYGARTDDGIDALVAAAALVDDRPCIVLTTDPRDLEELLADYPQVAVVRV